MKTKKPAAIKRKAFFYIKFSKELIDILEFYRIVIVQIILRIYDV